MTIASYDDVVSNVSGWLFGRTDILPMVPTFITLFEAKVNRKLFCRQMEQRAVTVLNPASATPQYLALPGDFQTMRRVRLINPFNPSLVSGTVDTPPLKFATGVQMDLLRERNLITGPPIWFTLFGNEMEVCPTPDQAYSIEMVYRNLIPALGSTNEVNWLLQLAPDAYLYGALMEAAPYLHEDDRIAVWSAGVQSAFDDLNKLSEEALYNAGPLTIRARRRGY
jgi:hypothetical protein